MVGGVPMLDLCYEEDARADVDMNVVMTGSGQFVEVQATAEHTPFDDAQMARLVALARGGIAELIEIQRKVTQICSGCIAPRATRESCARSAWRRATQRWRSNCFPAIGKYRRAWETELRSVRQR